MPPQPKFSVLMAVYAKDTPAHLGCALDSIWANQSVRPDQIVVVGDGPITDETAAVLATWQGMLGARFEVLMLPQNRGLGGALNKGLPLCQHELVARMDADDRSTPDRFSRQIAFMQAHPYLAASSAWIAECDAKLTKILGHRCPPTTPDALQRYARLRNPLNHPAAIFRKSAVMALGGYPEIACEDYALWSLMLRRGGRIAIQPEVLLHMRTGTEHLHRRGPAFFRGELALLKYQRQIGFLSRFETIRNALLRGAARLSPVFLRRLAYWTVRQFNRATVEHSPPSGPL